ncbi:hypothetical protein [Streptomyces sp. NP160]|uniref:hypothetical protein n=1 Tax=Streptomyces sp. NP160 TaxID=2586637 RepID=UPI0015D5E82C|nr:hypothetical protein [Streptomyces sp. NP160]
MGSTGGGGPVDGFGHDLLWRLPLTLVGGCVTALVVLHLVRSRETTAVDGARAWSFECWARVEEGEHPQLSRRWRVGRAVVSPRSIQLTLYRWGLRFRRLTPFVVDVGAVDHGGVRRAGWRDSLRFESSCRLVPVSTTGGVRLVLAVPARDASVVLDLLEGHPPPAPGAPGQPGEPCPPHHGGGHRQARDAR